MLEIVTPGAGRRIWFGHFGFGFGGTTLDFQAAVNCLAANTDVVVDDIGFFNNGRIMGPVPFQRQRLKRAQRRLGRSGPTSTQWVTRPSPTIRGDE